MKHKIIFTILFFALLVNFTQPTEVKAYSEAELLANIMYLENNSTGKTEEENIKVLLFTGSVVVNRMKSGAWGGTTVKDVLYAKGQYAYSTRKNIGVYEMPKRVKFIAKILLKYGSVIPNEVIYQSMQKNLGKRWDSIDREYFATKDGKTTKDYANEWLVNYIKDPIFSTDQEEQKILKIAWKLVSRDFGELTVKGKKGSTKLCLQKQ